MRTTANVRVGELARYNRRDFSMKPLVVCSFSGCPHPFQNVTIFNSSQSMSNRSYSHSALNCGQNSGQSSFPEFLHWPAPCATCHRVRDTVRRSHHESHIRKPDESLTYFWYKPLHTRLVACSFGHPTDYAGWFLAAQYIMMVNYISSSSPSF